ncbi:hypothetical protein [Pontiella agarivorans]|uniref:Uncharacterized protein n=1 Tax=Pontiella agarivorans TaxID=3038953 RepID=A0ABU5MSK5_9BACT|nr:hypothetical protein [Pontiella agarivorans]MDZ8117184.1 hypothetical protein [Pontiella agarivorans]
MMKRLLLLILSAAVFTGRAGEKKDDSGGEGIRRPAPYVFQRLENWRRTATARLSVMWSTDSCGGTEARIP